MPKEMEPAPKKNISNLKDLLNCILSVYRKVYIEKKVFQLHLFYGKVFFGDIFINTLVFDCTREMGFTALR
jgi:hypothetical protein